jgi:hypothetical protein
MQGAAINSEVTTNNKQRKLAWKRRGVDMIAITMRPTAKLE